MIDEEATYKKFGYHSTDLSPHSGKKVDWGAKIKAKMQNKLNGWYI